ncbi:hypothetical protein CK203_112551 [Vitis vinifera]|uniref:Uncharacterized protein n=1 Tax=Vitis vinifera TaxID=29760 RepID=A0A438CSE0_VITVI|nr:hypothetical protein CK203_112551 [Vitis vinifera]
MLVLLLFLSWGIGDTPTFLLLLLGASPRPSDFGGGDCWCGRELDCYEISLGRINAASACGDGSGLFRDSGDAEKENELALVPVGEFVMSLCEEEEACHREEGESGEGWSTSSLARFSHCLGMPTEGFEEEILYLLRRMKGEWSKRAGKG